MSVERVCESCCWVWGVTNRYIYRDLIQSLLDMGGKRKRTTVHMVMGDERRVSRRKAKREEDVMLGKTT